MHRTYTNVAGKTLRKNLSLGGLDEDGRIILKWIFKIEFMRVMWIHLAQDRVH
jgi:hypothetical protein